MEQKTSYGECLKRIAVLLGGDSPERDVSLQSGVAVAEALEQRGHQTRQIDLASVDPRSLDWSAVDVAFIALHGGAGENGQVQDLLEAIPIPYTGSGPRSSRRAFSKSAAKECFHEAGVPTPDYVLIHRSDSITRLRSMAGLIGFPLVIKPDQQGSSLGVSIVHSPDELIRAATLCFDFGPFGLMERAITGGGEWTLGIVDSQPLPLMKITPRSEFFDFSAKYEDDETGYTFDFQEPETVTQQIVRTGLSACRALATDGIARVDLLVDDTGCPWVLEVNTVPGMTDHSLVPKAAARAGISFPRLCDAEIRNALRRHHLRYDVSHRLDRTGLGTQLRAG